MKKTLLYSVSAIMLSFLFTNTISAQEGTLDETFGIGGKISNNFGGASTVFDAALQSDGKIIVIESATPFGQSSEFVIVRYLPNGDLDSSFDRVGATTILGEKDFGAGAIAIQPDGKIVVAGVIRNKVNGVTETDIMLIRYNEDGTLDATFDGDGIATAPLKNSQSGSAILLQADGKIVIGGTFSLDNWQMNTFGLARFNANGSIDTAYGTNGFVQTPTIFRGILNDIKFVDDENVIAVGTNFASNFLMVKYDATGQVITSFGSKGDGIIEEKFNKIAVLNKCVVSKDNHIYVAGSSLTDTKYNAFIGKYDSNGVVDTSFGGNGRIVKEFGSAIASFGDDIAIDSKDELIVGYGVGPTSNYDFALESYSLDGVLKTSFGTDGYFSTNFGAGHDYFQTMLIQPDNKIVMIGNNYDQVIARVNNSKKVVLSTDDFTVNSTVINVSPNPINEFPVLNLQLQKATTLSVDLYDAKGILVSSLIKNKSYAEGSTTEALSLSNNLAKGIYFLKLSSNGKLTKTIKIIK